MNTATDAVTTGRDQQMQDEVVGEGAEDKVGIAGEIAGGGTTRSYRSCSLS